MASLVAVGAFRHLFATQAYKSLRSIKRLPGPVRRNFATLVHPVNSAGRAHKVIVVGGGTAGLSISHQLLRSGRFAKDDIAVIDPETRHHYQAGWTLAGGGVKDKRDLRRPLASLVDPKIQHYHQRVQAFAPIDGLSEALSNPDAPVSSIYGYDHCDKTFDKIKKHKKGVALFTHPSGIVKCAGAPQKIMWLALDHWKRQGLYDSANPETSPVQIQFATAMPGMFGVPKYSAALEKLRKERGADGLFQHDLISIDGNTATIARPGSSESSALAHRRRLCGVHLTIGSVKGGEDSVIVPTADHLLGLIKLLFNTSLL
ncbi:hypothetical protein LQW54_001859 [Pestalotiopsis sp. IQ-011]